MNITKAYLLIIISLLSFSASIFADQAVSPIPGNYIGLVQNFEDPEKNIINDTVEQATFIIKPDNNLMVISPDGDETTLNWVNDKWVFQLESGENIQASIIQASSSLVIDYYAYRNNALIGKARFYLINQDRQ